ncbi:MAG: hypothetical protein GQ552_08505 [Flavobacteriaceae bacterium]|nr:hypothetical protein [Flavobacteriaceae bacterium]
MMYYLLKILLLISFLYNCQSDEISLVVNNPSENFTIKKVTTLSSKIDETSGLINFNGRIITHNDSGDKPNLYEIDITSGKVIRTVTISNAVNIDMEDITQDENSIYLCDIGNNSNKRKNQTIYKISKADYLIKDKVVAEIIRIKYKEQINFTKTNRKTNFDAEAVVNINDELFLFTKNWGDLKTSVYKIPKGKGNYTLTKIDSFDINGLITAATYNENTKTVILTGYLDFKPFIVELTNFSSNSPLDGKIDKKSIVVSGSKQIEGITVNPDGSYYMSAEESSGFSAILYKLSY